MYDISENLPLSLKENTAKREKQKADKAIIDLLCLLYHIG